MSNCTFTLEIPQTLNPKYDLTKKPDRMEINADLIPKELRDKAQWVLWLWEKGKKKWDKPPKRYSRRQIIPASSTDQGDWVNFNSALEALKASGADGIGIAITKENNLIAVDIDNCRHPVTGVIHDKAMEFVRSANSYAEVSVSGTGIRVWLRGTVDNKAYRTDSKTVDGLEVYCEGRYMTVSSNQIPGTPSTIAEAGNSFWNLMDNYMLRDDFAKQTGNYDPEWTRHCAIGMKEDGTKVGALWSLDPSMGFFAWIRVMFALQSIDMDLSEVFDEWSSGGDNYRGTEDVLKHWNCPGSEVKAGTLFKMAQDVGWTFPKRGYDMSEMGMAQRVADANDGDFWWVPDWGYWVKWDGTRYAKDEGGMRERIHDMAREQKLEALRELAKQEEELKGMKKAELKDKLAPFKARVEFFNQFGKERVLSAVERLTRTKLQRVPEDFNSNIYLLPLANGVYDLEAQTFCEHSKSNLNTVCSPVAYDESAEAPRWEQFIAEISCDDVNLQKYLQSICGYCLSGSTELQKMFVLIGEGSNGKSVFANMFRKVLGDQLAGPMSQRVLSPRYGNNIELQMTYLYGKRVVVSQETDLNCQLNESLVKELTGGDDIQGRGLYQDFETIRPSHKIILATNHKPTVNGTDDGIWRRIDLIPFNAKFSKDQQDKTLPAALDKELPGILQWFIKGWGEFKMYGAEEPLVVTNAKEAYRKEQNIVQQWAEDRCERGEDFYENRVTLYENFKDFLRVNGIYKEVKRSQFYRELEKLKITENGEEIPFCRVGRTGGMDIFRDIQIRSTMPKLPAEDA